MIIAVVFYGDQEVVTRLTDVNQLRELQSLRIQLSSPNTATHPETIWKQLSTRQYTPEPWPVGVQPKVKIYSVDGTGLRMEIEYLMRRPYHLPFPKTKDVIVRM